MHNLREISYLATWCILRLSSWQLTEACCKQNLFMSSSCQVLVWHVLWILSFRIKKRFLMVSEILLDWNHLLVISRRLIIIFEGAMVKFSWVWCHMSYNSIYAIGSWYVFMKVNKPLCIIWKLASSLFSHSIFHMNVHIPLFADIPALSQLWHHSYWHDDPKTLYAISTTRLKRPLLPKKSYMRKSTALPLNANSMYRWK